MQIADNTANGLVVHADEGDHVWHANSLVTIKARAADTGGTLGVVESIVPPGLSPPLHIHHDEDEAVYVLEGSLRVVCGARTYRAETGSFVFLPHGVAHTFRVEGDRPARLIGLSLPGGFEDFFEATGEPAREPRLPEPAELDLARIGTAFADHHVDIVGPPLD